MKEHVKFLPVLVLFGLLLCSNVSAQNKSYSIVSPDKDTHFDIGTGLNNQLRYRVLFKQKEVLGWSALGLQLQHAVLGSQIIITGETGRSKDESFSWPVGEDDRIISRYNEMTVSCKSAGIVFNLIVRVFDGSVAFRYEIPANNISAQTVIRKELTAFNLANSYTIFQYNQESEFKPVAIDSMAKTCDLPATITNGKYYISLGEANNTNYTKAELVKGAFNNSLAIAFPGDSAVTLPDHVSPWRTISISETAIGLHKFSQLYLKLNPPAIAGAVNKVKPGGKLIRAQLSTQAGLDCIDFAAKHNFQYIMFDAGWYGAEFRTSSDPTQVIPEINMSRVIAHGNEKGIGVILYVNYVGLRAKLDTILPLFKKWGVKGIKFGFVNALTQEGLGWLSTAIKKTTEYGFMLDIHDNYKPTGLSRTYPALLTQEGIRGDENSPDAFHTTTLPFTRFLAGPADFTFCYPNTTNQYSKNLKVSMAQQLALTVIYFSPLQSIFWYGKPNEYTNEDEIEFFKYVPTVWNESIYLAGDIGKNISVARRSGDKWFMGNAAGLMDWATTVPLDFLSKDMKYKATVYEDDGKGSILKKSFVAKKGDAFQVQLKAKGGQAIIFQPISNVKK